MIDFVRRVFAHVAWADARAIESLREAPDAEPQALKVLAHVLGSEEVWLARLVHGRMTRYLEVLQPADLHRSVPYHNSAGVAFESKVSDILMHMALHTSYHRGQVAAAVRRSGVAPLYTDYIAFVRGGAPARSGPENG
jgi:uncharacterized damage-inducible protein DinB